MKSKSILSAACVLFFSMPAFASSGGIDTPSTVNDLPLSVMGTPIVDLTSTSATIEMPLTVNQTTVLSGAVTVNGTANFNNPAWFANTVDFQNTVKFNNPVKFLSTISNPITIDQSQGHALVLGSNSIDTTGLDAGGNNVLFMQDSNCNATKCGSIVIGDGTTTQGTRIFLGGSLQTELPFLYQYGGAAMIFVNGNNITGGGIAISDDGGFYDYNDGFVTYNGSTGLRIAGSNGAASTNGILEVNGVMATNGLNPHDYPSGWAGGIRTWDVYAGGTIAVGAGGGAITTFMNNQGFWTSQNITISGAGNGIVFPDGTKQTTAPAPKYLGRTTSPSANDTPSAVVTADMCTLVADSYWGGHSGVMAYCKINKSGNSWTIQYKVSNGSNFYNGCSMDCYNF
jgi:hypothetical protein